MSNKTTSLLRLSLATGLLLVSTLIRAEAAPPALPSADVSVAITDVTLAAPNTPVPASVKVDLNWLSGSVSRVQVFVALYLSADPVFNIREDVQIGSNGTILIVKNQPRTLTVRTALPRRAKIPGYYLIARVVSSTKIADPDQSNNFATSTLLLDKAGAFVLTVLHNNDGESNLIDAGIGLENYGGVARFATVVANAKTAAEANTNGYVFVSSGDNFLAGPEFDATLSSLKTASPVYYDALALDYLDYDAIVLGNHDFDFGPDILAGMIGHFSMHSTPYLCANLDFTGEPALQALVTSGRIGGRVKIDVDGQMIGVVSAIYPKLATITSPRNAVVIDANNDGLLDLEDVRIVLQQEIDALTAEGVNKIIVASHLQSIAEELRLIPMIEDVDIVISGGGDELLANQPFTPLPGEMIAGPYPMLARSADGVIVPVVTTAGEYRYLGRLLATFDNTGRLISYAGNPIQVSGTGPQAVTPDPWLQTNVVTPVKAFVDNLALNRIGSTEVPLDGRRDGTGVIGVRNRETNLGNLIADSYIWQGAQLAAAAGLPVPQIALTNGGGIRNNSLIPVGPLTTADAGSILAFTNKLVIVPDVSPQLLKELLENAVSGRPFENGKFGQIGGFFFTYDVSKQAQQTTGSGASIVITVPGQRVQDVTLADGTVIVQDGQIVPGAPSVCLATIDFLATGGDSYPFNGVPFTALDVLYKDAFINYIKAPEANGGLGGVIRAVDYPLAGEGRSVQLP